MAVSVKTYTSASEAARALASERLARFMAGGTLVMRAVNEGDQSFDTIILATDPALRQIEPKGDRLVLGSQVTMAQILAHRELDFLHPVARAVGGPAVRTMASIGGNLFADHPYGDMTTALLALDAKITVVSGTSSQDVALTELLKDRSHESRSLVTAVSIVRPRGTEFRFRKVSRVKPKGVSVLAIAAHLPQSGGRVSGARVAYGSMAPTPVRAAAVEQALEGATLDEAGIAAAVAAASAGLEPPTDAIASSWYRQQVAPAHLKRLLLDVQGAAR